MTAPLAPVSPAELARTGVALGARAAVVRLAGRTGVAVGVAAIGLAAVAGGLQREATTAQAVDRALVAIFDLVIPLATFALVSAAIGRQRLQDAVWPLARFGADRRAVALGVIAASAGVSAAIAAIATVLGIVAAHGPTSPPLLLDAVTSAWIAALTAAAYAAWLSLGATFLRFGAGRLAVLIADFFLGAVGLVAWVMPRGLALNLLGLAATELPQRGASAALVVTALAAAALAALRCGR